LRAALPRAAGCRRARWGRIDGEQYDHLPPGIALQASVPDYETLPGWSSPVSGTRTWSELPAEAVRYVRRIEELVQVPVTMVSNGADRDATLTAPVT
jgi:adenylosuccinate synthase